MAHFASEYILLTMLTVQTGRCLIHLRVPGACWEIKGGAVGCEGGERARRVFGDKGWNIRGAQACTAVLVASASRTFREIRGKV